MLISLMVSLVLPVRDRPLFISLQHTVAPVCSMYVPVPPSHFVSETTRAIIDAYSHRCVYVTYHTVTLSLQEAEEETFARSAIHVRVA